MQPPPDRLPVIVLEIGLACVEAAISLLDNPSDLARIARDLEDVIEGEKLRIETEAQA